ncbi:DUF2637 domain-containing protein [Parafrankia sp. BMG5.11]|uniref:DUF2637 domain-containing protein n=1 Tax=Parafrankia sp. BMG5.11 TaxID=222540 RepID=UPI00103D4270|nr:DUF2637 domain-containing protein [Parafrankia sp. BMG5.11]TCJ34165.1 DUF2637 domain-containing protein [Parafrankia sp. BMG5.11]
MTVTPDSAAQDAPDPAAATPTTPTAAGSGDDPARAGPVPADTTSGRQGRAERVLGAALPVVLAVGVFCVAFVHVHDVAAWAGQPDWAAWLIAVSVELMALASIIEIRHRHRSGARVRWPVTTLVAGVGMSGAANLTAAGPDALTGAPGVWVPTMALWPVAAFGLVAGLKATRPDHPAPTPATAINPTRGPAPPVGDRAAGDGPQADRTAYVDATGPPPAALPADLLAAGRAVAVELTRQGRPVTRTALARGVRQRGHRCSTDRAAVLLAAVREPEPKPRELPATGPSAPEPGGPFPESPTTVTEPLRS